MTRFVCAQHRRLITDYPKGCIMKTQCIN